LLLYFWDAVRTLQPLVSLGLGRFSAESASVES
jgi:hypothetical protein